MFDGDILRWFSVFKCPEGVSVEEDEDWFLNTHAKQVVQQPGLPRFISCRAEESIPGRPPSPFHRVSEQWDEGFRGWERVGLRGSTHLHEATVGRVRPVPFLEPYTDFVNTFILEKPTLLRDYRGYVCDV